MPFVNYVRNLSLGQANNLFVLPWRSVLIRNNNKDGTLMLPSSLDCYRPTRNCMWVELKCAQFEDDGAVYAVLVCTICSSMKGILSLGPLQRKLSILSMRCHHAEAFMMLEKEWQTQLELPEVLPSGPSNLFRRPELKSLILRGQESEKLFLAVVQKSGNLSILHTISRQMKQPLCSKCSTCPCPCLKSLKVEESKKRGRDEEDEGAEGEREEVELPWSRKRQKKDPVHNFEDTVKQAVWYEEYGCNTTAILFPISRDPARSKAWLDRLSGHVFLPPAEGLCAEPDMGATCESHGNLFSREYKVKTSSNIVIYNAESEKVHESPTYACGTGSCRCLFQLDGDPYQLWHIRKGSFIEYTYLHSYILRHLSAGIPVNAEYAARSHALASLGLQTTMTVTDFQHAIAGFRALLSFPPDAFTCPSCSKHPRYLVFDGTDLGPAQKKVSHLTELTKPGEDSPLPQGGFFEDRTFMSSYSERELVCNLLTGELEVGDFCEATFTTEEGSQIKELVQRLHSTGGSISQGYKRFLANVCKEQGVPKNIFIELVAFHFGDGKTLNFTQQALFRHCITFYDSHFQVLNQKFCIGGTGLMLAFDQTFSRK